MARPVSPAPPQDQDRASAAPPKVDQPAGARSQPTSGEQYGRSPNDSQVAPSQTPKQGDPDDIHTTRVSHVRILPTSLPYVHDQLMEQREREQRAREDERQAQAALAEEDRQDAGDKELSAEEQEATARALKPHARSLVDLDKLRFEPPESHTAPHQPKKARKWQFGIRSRNQPYEAILYLYKAIAAQGGVWEIQPAEAGQSSTRQRITSSNSMYRRRSRLRTTLPRHAQTIAEQILRPTVRLLHPQRPLVHPLAPLKGRRQSSGPFKQHQQQPE